MTLIDKFRKAYGLTSDAQAGKILGRSQQAMSDCRTGKVAIRTELAYHIKDLLRLNAEQRKQIIEERL